MIPAVIFSRDRACQLDALLRSIQRHAPGVFDPIRVLRKATSRPFARAYEHCELEHPEAVFIAESVFREDVMCLLEGHLVCFFVDDDLLFGPVDTSPIEALSHEEVAAFSLRLGENTTRCYPLDQEQEPPRIVSSATQSFGVWIWTVEQGDFSYPLSLDGHVLRVSDVRALLEGRDCTNPNELEDVLASQHRRLAATRPLMASYETSRLVGIPANVVTATHRNRYAASWATAAALNHEFLCGKRIDIDRMDFSLVRGAHEEVDLVLA